MQLLQDHANDLGSTLFVDELCLCGEARVDVAVVNAALSGFELKSASDTLKRLPAQVEVYSRVLDFCTIVVAENHLDHALPLIPPWWGCIAARWDGKEAVLDEIASPQRNYAVDAYALAQLLWRDEALAALEEVDAARGYRSKPRRALWERLTQVVEIDVLRELVRDGLRSRERWRPGSLSIRSGLELSTGDAAFQPSPRSVAYQ
ncbi:sce7726 family protein [Mycobacterium sp. 5-140-3-2]